MIKLKPEHQVIYIDNNLVDKTKVVSINKEQGTATLANGIVINREPIKKGYYKRTGKRSEAKAYYYEEGKDYEGNKIYQAYLYKVTLKKTLIQDLVKAIDNKDLIHDQSWFSSLYNNLIKFI